MSLREQVYSVLIVSAAENINLSLQKFFQDTRFHPIRFESSISSAKRTLLARSFDFVIVNSPLPDDPGIGFAIDVCNNKNGVSLLLVRTDLYASTYDKVAEHGVFVISKPTSKPLVSQSLDWMVVTHERLKKLERKTVSIEDKMKEIRLVNRAKWLLIEELKMSETDAHRYVEKQAMDRCISRREVAEIIIKNYS